MSWFEILLWAGGGAFCYWQVDRIARQRAAQAVEKLQQRITKLENQASLTQK